MEVARNDVKMYLQLKTQLLLMMENIEKGSTKDGANIGPTDSVRIGDWCMLKDELNSRWKEYLDAYAKYENIVGMIKSAFGVMNTEVKDGE